MSRAAGAVPSLRAAARGSAAGPTMIKAILIFNNHGKPRLSKFYQRYVWVGRAAPRRAGRGGHGEGRVRRRSGFAAPRCVRRAGSRGAGLRGSRAAARREGSLRNGSFQAVLCRFFVLLSGSSPVAVLSMEESLAQRQAALPDV